MEKKDKKMEQIITSLLDTDLYKFNMNQVIFHKHTDLNAVYYFKCRNEGVVFTKEMVDEINRTYYAICAFKRKSWIISAPFVLSSPTTWNFCACGTPFVITWISP